MTKEEELLTKVLCEQFPYGVQVYGNYRYHDGDKIVDDERVGVIKLSTLDWFFNGIEIKPYLRPMSSMTEEERIEYNIIKCSICPDEPDDYAGFVDWLNAHHFDYRGLIEKGLAIAAVGEDNPYKKKGGNNG